MPLRKLIEAKTQSNPFVYTGKPADAPAAPADLSKAEDSLSRILSETLALDAHPISAAPRIQRKPAALLRWYVVFDALALTFAFFIASWIAATMDQFYFNRGLYNPATNEWALRIAKYFLVAAGVLLSFEHKGHYRSRMPFWLEAQKVIGMLSIAMVLDGFLQFASNQHFSRVSLVAGWGLAAIFVIAFRAAFRAVMRHYGKWQVPTLLIGNGATGKEAKAALGSELSLGYVVTAEIANFPRAFEQAGQSWKVLCDQHGADYVVVALEGPDLSYTEEPIAQLMREGLPFSVVPPLRHMSVHGMEPQYFYNHNVMLLTRSCGLEQPLQRFIKRSFDVFASSVALVLLSPLFAMLALAVKSDGGPVFFGHKRVGRNGKFFTCLKFRSMRLNADDMLRQCLDSDPEAAAEWQRNRKLRHDPRVTPIGRFLRRTSLDELPQLLNVLCGDMSLVGPRPIAIAEIDCYDNDIAHYYRVRPGITGLWQVSGRNEISYAGRVQMDSWYVRNWSFWHDVAILCKTVPALVNRTGAY